MGFVDPKTLFLLLFNIVFCTTMVFSNLGNEYIDKGNVVKPEKIVFSIFEEDHIAKNIFFSKVDTGLKNAFMPFSLVGIEYVVKNKLCANLGNGSIDSQNECFEETNDLVGEKKSCFCPLRRTCGRAQRLFFSHKRPSIRQ
jgi:hypothetical protein